MRALQLLPPLGIYLFHSGSSIQTSFVCFFNTPPPRPCSCLVLVQSHSGVSMSLFTNSSPKSCHFAGQMVYHAILLNISSPNRNFAPRFTYFLITSPRNEQYFGFYVCGIQGPLLLAFNTSSSSTRMKKNPKYL